MKTDQEKLWDAVGMLDGETVQTAMTRAAHMQAAIRPAARPCAAAL